MTTINKAKKEKTSTKIGAFIKARRKERDLTQQQLSFYAEVSFTLVNRVENGDLNVRVESLNKLLKVFGYELGPVPVKANSPVRSETTTSPRKT